MNYFHLVSNTQALRNALEGLDVNAKGINGLTLLYIACGYGCIESIHILLEKGAIVDPISEIGITPLYRACVLQKEEIVEILLEYKANVNIQDRNGNTPLHKVTILGNEKIIKLLLKYGANPYIINDNNKDCFYFANKRVKRLLNTYELSGGKSTKAAK